MPIKKTKVVAKNSSKKLQNKVWSKTRSNYCQINHVCKYIVRVSSENDVLNAITFLVTNEIISIDMANESMSLGNQGIGEQKISWNTNAPIIIPLSEGYHARNIAYFIHPEISDSSMADMMSQRINFPTLYAPELKNISEEQFAKVYAFTNGIPGSEPYGGV